MIYVHSLGRAVRYYGEQTALSIGGKRLTFSELHHRVERIAAALSRRGLRTGDRLAVLLPNGPEYIELVYACSRLGVIVVPLNARYSSREIDRVLKDASPRALVRHSGSAPTRANLEWQLALDKEPLDAPNGLCPEVYYCPEAILAIIYTSGTTGEAKGVMLTHTNVLSNVYCLNYWMRYRQGGVYLHAAPMFQGADFPAMFAAPAFGALQVTVPRFSPRAFCEAVEKERITPNPFGADDAQHVDEVFGRQTVSILAVLRYWPLADLRCRLSSIGGLADCCRASNWFICTGRLRRAFSPVWKPQKTLRGDSPVDSLVPESTSR